MSKRKKQGQTPDPPLIYFCKSELAMWTDDWSSKALPLIMQLYTVGIKEQKDKQSSSLTKPAVSREQRAFP